MHLPQFYLRTVTVPKQMKVSVFELVGSPWDILFPAIELKGDH